MEDLWYSEEIDVINPKTSLLKTPPRYKATFIPKYEKAIFAAILYAPLVDESCAGFMKN
ncbi:hypothetical protein [Alkalibaculum sporogenes]|uniref:hypothetical protein n=1 Tax=Alkalibaculum sporogenes TaxID=2655001 RepID=UPI00187B57F8|nr:hypothetical protein [Alkalibaculum sporogenes]